MTFSSRWICTFLILATPCFGQDYEESASKYQVTWNRQYHSAFNSPSGSQANDLTATRDWMYTFTATAHWGFRPWAGGEIYFDPEMVTGIPFSNNLIGLGGFTNGEITRAAGSNPSFYRQRLFLRQTWGRGGGDERVESGFNQMAGTVDKNRTVLTIGNFSTLDVFDANSYAKDPRTQFMNWGNWTYAAYDYAADSRGYGWGFALEWYQDDWAYRIGRMSAPASPNGQPVDLALARHYGDQVEIEHNHQIAGRDGAVRVLGYHNRAAMANFNDATAYLRSLGSPTPVQTGPDALVAVRTSDKDKYGLGVNVEQAFSDDVGFFLRAMKSDGKTETLAFTEVDASLSTGLVVNGHAWGRANDALGLAYMVNKLSSDRQKFLEAGGVSFFIGSGDPASFAYAPEKIFETYYSLGFSKNRWVTFDVQQIKNPAYNANRGPVHVYAVRLHTEF